MIKWFRKILLRLDMFFNTKTFKENVIYENKKHNVFVVISEDLKVVQLFNKGLLFKVPLDLSVDEDSDIEKALDTIADLNIELSSSEELQEMLDYYEDIEDYEKCREIKDILKKKNKE